MSVDAVGAPSKRADFSSRGGVVCHSLPHTASRHMLWPCSTHARLLQCLSLAASPPHCTRSFYQMTGYGPDEVLGHNWCVQHTALCYCFCYCLLAASMHIHPVLAPHPTTTMHTHALLHSCAALSCCASEYPLCSRQAGPNPPSPLCNTPPPTTTTATHIHTRKLIWELESTVLRTWHLLAAQPLPARRGH